MFKGYTYLFIEGYLVQDHDMILRAIELAKEAGLQICLDMASYNIVEQDHDFFSLLINKYVDIVFANEEEAKAFTGKEPEEALDVIAKMCSIAIVKLGARGSLIRKGTEEVHVHAVTVDRVIDTTGAGDYFAAGFFVHINIIQSIDRKRTFILKVSKITIETLTVIVTLNIDPFFIKNCCMSQHQRSGNIIVSKIFISRNLFSLRQ